MPKYSVNIHGHVDVVVQGANAKISISDGQVFVNGRQVYPKPHSEAKWKLWDAIQKAEAALRDSPLFETNMVKWLEARDKIDAAWTRYHEME